MHAFFSSSSPQERVARELVCVLYYDAVVGRTRPGDPETRRPGDPETRRRATNAHSSPTNPYLACKRNNPHLRTDHPTNPHLRTDQSSPADDKLEDEPHLRTTNSPEDGPILT
jgi:hypothetical protein